MKKLSRITGFILVIAMVFSLLSVSAFAILCDDEENVNQEGYVVAEKNGPTKSPRGFMAIGGEIRPEDDEPYDGVHIDEINSHK